MAGRFMIDRATLDHPIVGVHNPKRYAAWCWMIAEARWKKSEVFIGGKVVTLQRGQFSCSLRFMAKKLGFSVKEIRTFLALLKKGTMIDTDTDTGQYVITICNYSKYQDKEASQDTQKGTARAQQGHSKGTNNNKDEIKNNNNPPIVPPVDEHEHSQTDKSQIMARFKSVKFLNGRSEEAEQKRELLFQDYTRRIPPRELRDFLDSKAMELTDKDRLDSLVRAEIVRRERSSTDINNDPMYDWQSALGGGQDARAN
jgi:DNA-binding transcriptional MerR regulator